MPGPKRAAKIEAKRKKHETQPESHEDNSEQLDSPESEVDAIVEEITDDDGEFVSADHLDDHTKEELKDIAGALNLPTYGTKAEIIDRIRNS